MQRFVDVVEQAFLQVYGIDTGMTSNKSFEYGLISEAIFRGSSISTGLISEKASMAVANGYPYEKLTKEHFFGRAGSATKLIKMIRDGKSFNRCLAFVMSRSRVHRVTKQENIDLRKYQGNPEYKTWHQEYAAAGIELIPYVKKNARVYTYHIDGVEYTDVKTIADKYELSVPGVDYRFRSNSKRFVGWKRVKK